MTRSAGAFVPVRPATVGRRSIVIAAASCLFAVPPDSPVEGQQTRVKAMVGGRDFARSQVNLALGGTLGVQPGSSFKPIIYLTAIDNGYTPSSIIVMLWL